VPFVALVVSVLDVVLPDSRREEFVDWVFSSLPGREIEASVDRSLVESGASAPLISLLSLALLLWAASGMMASVRLALAVVWSVERGPRFVRAKLGDVALVAGAGALLVGAFGLSVVAHVVAETGANVATALGWDAAGGALAALGEVLTSWLAAAAALLVVYVVVPPVHVSVADAWPSALGVAVALQIAVAGFAVYAARIADFSSVYGPVGTVFAFLVLVYLLAILVLVGGEVVAARAGRRGKADDRSLV
jgi:membrane protein